MNMKQNQFLPQLRAVKELFSSIMIFSTKNKLFYFHILISHCTLESQTQLSSFKCLFKLYKLSYISFPCSCLVSLAKNSWIVFPTWIELQPGIFSIPCCLIATRKLENSAHCFFDALNFERSVRYPGFEGSWSIHNFFLYRFQQVPLSMNQART